MIIILFYSLSDKHGDIQWVFSRNIVSIIKSIMTKWLKNIIRINPIILSIPHLDKQMKLFFPTRYGPSVDSTILIFALEYSQNTIHQLTSLGTMMWIQVLLSPRGRYFGPWSKDWNPCTLVWHVRKRKLTRVIQRS